MSNTVKPIPEGYHSITPYLIINGAAKAIEFYKQAFGATELFRMEHEGKIGHAEMQIGDSRIMLADEHPDLKYLGPDTLNGSCVNMMLYVSDVDAVFPQALSAGATEQRPIEDKFYGDRMGSLVDPFGHVWHVGTHKEDVTPEEMEKRLAAGAHG
jgi:PhnB protein